VIEQDPLPPKPARLPLPVVTIVLAAANIGAFLLSLSAGADPMAPTPDQIFALGGNFGPATLDGDWWRLVTSMFLHYGVLHIAMNMVGLIDGGRHVERLYGRAAFLALYLFAGVAGSLVSALPGKAVSAGASGAIFGIFGAWGAYLLFHRDKIDKELLAKQSKGLLIFLAYNIWFGLTAEGIDMRAHLGGLGAGFVAGLILASDKQYVARVVAIFVGAVVVVGVTATGVVPKPQANVLLASAKADIEKFAKIESRALDRYNQLVKDDKLTQEEIANIIELEILPVWREGKTLVWSIGHLPDKMNTNLRAYIETREKAWVAMVAALRKNDQAGLAEAMNTMTEAETYVEKLKE
jgi:membrane associated rhomboid family serine protease